MQCRQLREIKLSLWLICCSILFVDKENNNKNSNAWSINIISHKHCHHQLIMAAAISVKRSYQLTQALHKSEIISSNTISESSYPEKMGNYRSKILLDILNDSYHQYRRGFFPCPDLNKKTISLIVGVVTTFLYQTLLYS